LSTHVDRYKCCHSSHRVGPEFVHCPAGPFSTFRLLAGPVFGGEVYSFLFFFPLHTPSLSQKHDGNAFPTPQLHVSSFFTKFLLIKDSDFFPFISLFPPPYVVSPLTPPFFHCSTLLRFSYFMYSPLFFFIAFSLSSSQEMR